MKNILRGIKTVFMLAIALALTVAVIARPEGSAEAPPEDYANADSTQDQGIVGTINWIVDSLKGEPDLSEYPEGLRELYEKNPDARDFVLGYFDEHSAAGPEDIDLSSLDISSVPLLMQWDQRWGYAEYSGELLGLSGCGPTCLSMAAIYLTHDTDLNPLYVARYATEQGYYCQGMGSTWTLFSEGASGLGLRATELPLDEYIIDRALAEGKPVVLSLGPGDFTDTGHFILVTGLTDDGYIVNDPNSYQNSKTIWKYEDIRDQILNLWSMERA